MSERDLANRVTVSVMVDAYKQAGDKVSQAYSLLEEAKNILEGAYGDHYSDFDTIPDRHSYSSNYQDLAREVMQKIKKHAWRVIVNRLGIKKVMSIKASEELDKKLEEGKNMPELETAAVFDIMNMLVQQSQEYARAAVLEVYDLLRPARTGDQGWGRELKTNQKNGKFALGKKVILAWKVEGSYSSKTPFRVSYSNENQFLAIDKVFHQLDGAGVPEGYKSELVDAINTSPDGFGETEYFKFRACSNRNLHLEFKRLDLVSRINQIAGADCSLRD